MLLLRRRKLLRRLKKEIAAGEIKTSFVVGINSFHSWSSVCFPGDRFNEIKTNFDGSIYLNGIWKVQNYSKFSNEDALWLGKKLHFWIGKRHKLVK